MFICLCGCRPTLGTIDTAASDDAPDSDVDTSQADTPDTSPADEVAASTSDSDAMPTVESEENGPASDTGPGPGDADLDAAPDQNGGDESGDPVDDMESSDPNEADAAPEDLCPLDANKTAPGECGCGVTDVDSDGDHTVNCNDACTDDPAKIAPGVCGCGATESLADMDNDGTPDCVDDCPSDANKTSPWGCGCGNDETLELCDGIDNDCDPDTADGADEPWFGPDVCRLIAPACVAP